MNGTSNKGFSIIPAALRLLPAFLLLFLLTGCRALPERNYLGMTRDQVLDAVAETPKVDWGKRPQFWVCVPSGPNAHDTSNNLYFETMEELKKDERVRSARLLGIFYREHWSGFRFYYELTFENDRVVKQKVYAYSDGVTLLPAFFFHDYPGEKSLKNEKN